MPEISKNIVDGVEYGIKDSVARNTIGDTTALATTDKTSLVAAINELAASAGGGGSANTIIDVVALPETNIDENAFYRLLTAEFVMNQKVLAVAVCHCVNSLPSVGEAVTTDMQHITAYYSVADENVYAYINDALSAQIGVPVGWQVFGPLYSALGYPWAGVVTSLPEASESGTTYLVLDYTLYYYKDGWKMQKSIGWKGAGPGAEIFNSAFNTASNEYSHAEGYKTTASGLASHAEGNITKATENHSHAEGYGATASGGGSHAEGNFTHAEAAASHAEGGSTTASGECSHAEGAATTASGYCSHAEGSQTVASGYYSHAEGAATTASGYYSHAEGSKTVAEGGYAHSEGQWTHAKGTGSHAEGFYTAALGKSSHAEGNGSGFGCNLTGDANSLTYLVNSSNTIPVNSIVILNGVPYDYTVPNNIRATVTAVDVNSHTITVDKTLSSEAINEMAAYILTDGLAVGDYSHSEGHLTRASGAASHSEGKGTNANGDASHAEGFATNAYSKAQHVQGEYNIPDTEGNANTRGKYAHIVGNGTDAANRSNAHTLDWEGNAWYAGSVEATHMILKSPNGTRFKVTVDDSGNLSATAL